MCLRRGTASGLLTSAMSHGQRTKPRTGPCFTETCSGHPTAVRAWPRVCRSFLLRPCVTLLVCLVLTANGKQEMGLVMELANHGSLQSLVRTRGYTRLGGPDKQKFGKCASRHSVWGAPFHTSAHVLLVRLCGCVPVPVPVPVSVSVSVFLACRRRAVPSRVCVSRVWAGAPESRRRALGTAW